MHGPNNNQLSYGGSRKRAGLLILCAFAAAPSVAQLPSEILIDEATLAALLSGDLAIDIGDNDDIYDVGGGGGTTDVYDVVWSLVVPMLTTEPTGERKRVQAEVKPTAGNARLSTGLAAIIDDLLRDLRGLRQKLDVAETEALRDYVRLADADLKQVHRQAIAERACQGKVEQGPALAAALAEAGAVRDARLREVVDGLVRVVGADTLEGIMSEARAGLASLAQGEPQARYASLTQDQLVAEISSVCG